MPDFFTGIDEENWRSVQMDKKAFLMFYNLYSCYRFCFGITIHYLLTLFVLQKLSMGINMHDGSFA